VTHAWLRSLGWRTVVRGWWIGVALLALGCSDINGFSKSVEFGNWTSVPITISHLAPDGRETLLRQEIAPDRVGSIVIAPNEVGRCSGGSYIARDLAGHEVARQAENRCDSWVVATAPIPVSITNRTTGPVDVVYLGFQERVLSKALASGAVLTTSIQQLGDPSALCLGGYLIARDRTGHELTRKFVLDCGDWIWDIVAGPSSSPTGGATPT
jgi:hypothetical protein